MFRYKGLTKYCVFEDLKIYSKLWSVSEFIVSVCTPNHQMAVRSQYLMSTLYYIHMHIFDITIIIIIL